MNLDRFSTPLAHERLSHTKEFEHMHLDEIDEEVVTCCGCNVEIDETESFIAAENPIAGKDYIHDLDECINAYYLQVNEKDLLCESRSLRKVI